MLLSEHENIPWEALSYLIGGVSYGGRVTDEWDRRCLHALLDRFFCPEALQPDYSFSPDKVKYLYYLLKANIASPGKDSMIHNCNSGH